MNAVGYLRVSTNEQTNGTGLDAQRDAILATGHTIVAWYSDEGISGSNGLDKRIGLANALADIKEGKAEALIVYKMDRLARDMMLQESLLRDLWRSGGQIISCSEAESVYCKPDDATDPSRAFIRQVLGAAAEYERAIIKARLMAGRRRHLDAGGNHGGKAPYGWKWEGSQLVHDDDQWDIVQGILTRAKQGETASYIAQVLNHNGSLSPAGKQWGHMAVKRIIERETT